MIEHFIHENIEKSIKSTYELKGIEAPKLPAYKQFKRIRTQNDVPLNQWSCDHFALLTALHLMLGSKFPHEIKENIISRKKC